MANNGYTLGRGKVYFSLFKADTQIPAGYRYVGNTPEFNLTIDSDELEHFNSDEGVQEKDDSVPLTTNRSGNFTTDAVKPENIARFFFGENSQVVIVGASVTDEDIEDVSLGHSYQLGYDEDTNPIGNRMVSNVVVNGAVAVKASKAGTFSGPGTDGDTIVIAGKTYRLKDTIAAINDVLIGEDAASTAYNLEQAVNGGDGAGFLYYTGTVAHTTVDAQSAGAVVTITAKTGGTAGNALAISESSSNFAWAGAAVFLSGGSASTGVVAASNYTVDEESGLLTINDDAADIVEGSDLTVDYDYASGTREQVLSGSTPVEGAMLYIAKNPKGHNFHYTLPWVKLTPNGDYALKSQEWQTIPFNVEILKKETAAAIYVDGKEFVRA